MAKTQDVNSMMKDAMSAFPVDSKAFENMFKSQSALAEKVSAVAIDAAQKSTEISHRWMQETLGKFATITTAKTEPADYAKSVGDFVQTSAQTAAEHMAAFAEIAKKLQMETVELMLATGKEVSEDATAAVKKATADVTTVARKTAAAAAAR